TRRSTARAPGGAERPVDRGRVSPRSSREEAAMERRLIVMRHARSGWEGGEDHARPLTDRGRREAPAIAHRLAALFWVPELVLASDARRTEETWERIAGAFAPEPPIRFARELYLADAEDLIEVLGGVGDEIRTLQVIGHNPGL